MHDYSHAIFHRNRQVMAYIIQHLMVYTCIKYPLPGIFFNDSRESTVHNN